MLPRDLEVGEDGRKHIQVIMSMKAWIGGAATFVDLAQPFLAVITHPAILDCLTVDTFVGVLYNFISGTNGQRVIPFFQSLCASLDDAYSKSNISQSTAESTPVAMMIALHETLKREQLVAHSSDLLKVIDSTEKVAKVLDSDERSVFLHSYHQRNTEIRTIVSRAKGLLMDTVPPPVGGVSTTVVKSTFPRTVVVPGGSTIMMMPTSAT